MKKILSVLLILTVLCAAFICCPISTGAAATQNQLNIVGWADWYYDITWVALKTIPGWHGGSSHTFYEGNTYRIPYAQPINRGKYIGFGVSVEDFLAAASDVNSVFYTTTSTYGDTYSTYYGMDCSAFVSSCWGVSRHTTYYIPSISDNLGSVSESTIDKLTLGDALNSKSVGHVVLITDIQYENGKVAKVEVTEETPPQLKRTVYTRSSLISKYSAYTIQRYTGDVPAPPTAQTAAKIRGDADGDEEVTILDVTNIQRFLVAIELKFFDEEAADVDRDEEVTILDATYIQRFLAGISVPDGIGEAILT